MDVEVTPVVDPIEPSAGEALLPPGALVPVPLASVPLAPGAPLLLPPHAAIVVAATRAAATRTLRRPRKATPWRPYWCFDMTSSSCIQWAGPCGAQYEPMSWITSALITVIDSTTEACLAASPSRSSQAPNFTASP